MKWRHAVVLAGLAGCRFGGPSADPYEYMAFPDAETDATSTSMAPHAGEDEPSAAPAGEASAGDLDAGDLDAGDLDAGDLDGGNLDALCSPVVTVAVCDPVHNTGCNPLQQCDVDPSQTSMPTGQCVFGGGAEGGTCTTSIFTESCPPKSTCVDGGCRQLCFCNADCPGQCCSDNSGPPGFTMCGPCGP
jgi:hypothetical protein